MIPRKMNEMKPDQVLDLKGVSCPMNFVKTKLVLEEMEAGQILEIILDDGDPIKNVSGSIKEEGHQILKVEQLDDCWRLVVKKSREI